MTKHAQAIVEHPQRGPVAVDRELAPVLLSLWASGVSTDASCQDNPSGYGYAYILPSTPGDMGRLLTLASPRHITTASVDDGLDPDATLDGRTWVLTAFTREDGRCMVSVLVPRHDLGLS